MDTSITRTITISPLIEGKMRAEEPPVFGPEEIVAERFRIVRPLGAGGMGQVFEAEDLELRTPVALKVIRPRATQDENAEELFRREVQMARRVTHPNVCRIFDLVVHHSAIEGTGWGQAGRPILALTMELLDGETLSTRIARQGPLPRSEALDLLLNLAAALDAAHHVGVYHCDFKSSNVILTSSRGVVTDFGLARCAWTEDRGLDSKLRGTPAYLAPEVVSGDPPSAASDLYALGMVAFQVLTGELPDNEERTERPSITAELPTAATAVLARAMHPNPAERFPDGASLVSAINEAYPRHRTGWLRRSRFRALAACALLTGLALMTASVRSPEQAETPAETHLDDARRALKSADYSSSRAAAARAVVAARTIEDPGLEAQAHLLIASAFEAMGDPARADEAMTAARRLLEAAGDQCGLASASLILRDTADAERSPLPIQELPDILEECGDMPRYAIALARVGNLRSRTEPDEAKRMVEKALALAEKSGDHRALALVSNTIGSFEYYFENLGASEEAFGRAVSEARKAEDPYLLAGILCNRSWILNWLGRYEEEAALLREASALARQIGNRYLLTRILASEAKIHERRGDLRLANANLDEAYRLALKLGDVNLLGMALEEQAKVHERSGQWIDALESRRRAASLLEEQEQHDHPLELDRRHLALARILLKLDRVPEGQVLVEDIVERYSLNADGDSTAIYSRFQRIQFLLHQEKLREAADQFQELLPYVVAKEEVGLRRDTARMAVELDQQLGQSRFANSWQKLATTAAEKGTTPSETLLALQMRADLGRLLWFQGDPTGAQQHFEEVVRLAHDAGQENLATQVLAEPEALKQWKDYWLW